MNFVTDILPWVLIVVGALVTFLAKPVLKKGEGSAEAVQKKIYVCKIIGMWLVVIGAVIIFWAGGSFGVRNQ